MLKVTAKIVAELRKKTGAGIMDCKKALISRKNIEDAIIFLRENGLAKAIEKSSRIATDGLIGMKISKDSAVLLEINCETDFVSRGDDFKFFVNKLINEAMELNFIESDQEQVEKLLNTVVCFANKTKTVKQIIDDMVYLIGEKVSLRRIATLNKGNFFGGYLHCGGNVGVILSMKVADKTKIKHKEINILAKNISMHIAAMSPLSISRNLINSSEIDIERKIFKKQAIEQGKPKQIVEKNVNGKMEKFFAKNCLLEQSFIKNSEINIKDLINEISEKFDTKIIINKFIRFKVGEGIYKKHVNFADEVAKIV